MGSMTHWVPTSTLRPSMVLKTWGNARHGVLGHGEGGNEEIPRVLELAVGVVSIACGELHCIALTDAGTVLSWGSGTLGALGHGVTGACRTPAEVGALREVGPVVQVCAGSHHSLVRNAAGAVFGWGTIGLEGACEAHPRRQEGLEGRAAQIGCGNSFCTALVPSGVQAWGGALGRHSRFVCAVGGAHSLSCGATTFACISPNGDALVSPPLRSDGARLGGWSPQEMLAVSAPSGEPFVSIGAGAAFTAALTASGCVCVFAHGAEPLPLHGLRGAAGFIGAPAHAFAASSSPLALPLLQGAAEGAALERLLHVQLLGDAIEQLAVGANHIAALCAPSARRHASSKSPAARSGGASPWGGAEEGITTSQRAAARFIDASAMGGGWEAHRGFGKCSCADGGHSAPSHGTPRYHPPRGYAEPYPSRGEAYLYTPRHDAFSPLSPHAETHTPARRLSETRTPACRLFGTEGAATERRRRQPDSACPPQLEQSLEDALHISATLRRRLSSQAPSRPPHTTTQRAPLSLSHTHTPRSQHLSLSLSHTRTTQRAPLSLSLTHTRTTQRAPLSLSLSLSTQRAPLSLSLSPRSEHHTHTHTHTPRSEHHSLSLSLSLCAAEDYSANPIAAKRMHRALRVLHAKAQSASSRRELRHHLFSLWRNTAAASAFRRWFDAMRRRIESQVLRAHSRGFCSGNAASRALALWRAACTQLRLLEAWSGQASRQSVRIARRRAFHRFRANARAERAERARGKLAGRTLVLRADRALHKWRAAVVMIAADRKMQQLQTLLAAEEKRLAAARAHQPRARPENTASRRPRQARVRSTFDKLFGVIEAWEAFRIRPAFAVWARVAAR
ncbi:hypothetical protein AB1Y20_012022 [Prymnesium parvum]|uniref:Uncharacterized protein n=1 Tax=Prymnesium parvum TaxID=97485 RepID=A0AB34IQX9_PRYPA